MLIGDQALTDFIRRTIRQTGPVTFAWFMERALYHAELGYYSSGRCALGRQGDYFTNVSVGPLFGQLMAAQFAETWEALGRPEDFMVVEQGAHHGDFARDVLKATQERTPDFFKSFRYLIIEPFRILEARQRETLSDFQEKLSWEKSVQDLEPFSGIHFSNELLDAMPVHLVSKVSSDTTDPGAARENWKEKCVVESDDSFGFVTRPIADQRLRRHLDAINGDLREPYDTEVNLAALKWVESVGQKLRRGYILAGDYGYPRDCYYAAGRKNGTLQCRARHRMISSPFSYVGEIDITAHVDWTSLAEEGEAHGLVLGGFTDQHHFLTGIISAFLPESVLVGADPGSRRALQMLLHPESLGRAFQFLALMKDLPPNFCMSGFRFGRDPRAALGLSTQEAAV